MSEAPLSESVRPTGCQADHNTPELALVVRHARNRGNCAAGTGTGKPQLEQAGEPKFRARSGCNGRFSNLAVFFLLRRCRAPRDSATQYPAQAEAPPGQRQSTQRGGARVQSGARTRSRSAELKFFSFFGAEQLFDKFSQISLPLSLSLSSSLSLTPLCHFLAWEDVLFEELQKGILHFNAFVVGQLCRRHRRVDVHGGLRKKKKREKERKMGRFKMRALQLKNIQFTSCIYSGRGLRSLQRQRRGQGSASSAPGGASQAAGGQCAPWARLPSP